MEQQYTAPCSACEDWEISIPVLFFTISSLLSRLTIDRTLKQPLLSLQTPIPVARQHPCKSQSWYFSLLLQVTYGTFDARLSDKGQYPSLYQVAPKDSTLIRAAISLFLPLAGHKWPSLYLIMWKVNNPWGTWKRDVKERHLCGIERKTPCP